MKKKVFAIASATLLVATLAGCDYDGHFRYPCQDPENWKNAECQPPVCQATGTCTTDLLGYDPFAPESATIEEDQNTDESETTEVIVEESEVVEDNENG